MSLDDAVCSACLASAPCPVCHGRAALAVRDHDLAEKDREIERLREENAACWEGVQTLRRRCDVALEHRNAFFTRGEKHGRSIERASVVAWLRAEGHEQLARAFEQGEHGSLTLPQYARRLDP